MGQKVEEVRDKERKLKEALAGALENAKTHEPLTPEFDTAYVSYLSLKGELVKMPAELAKAEAQEKEEATHDLCVKLAQGVEQLLAGLEVAKAQGEPIIALRYAQDSTGTGYVVLNPITKLRASKPREPKANGSSRPWIVDSKGSHLTVSEFCRPYCGANKYPHKAVTCQAEFDAFCLKHGLTGYTYMS